MVARNLFKNRARWILSWVLMKGGWVARTSSDWCVLIGKYWTSPSSLQESDFHEIVSWQISADTLEQIESSFQLNKCVMKNTLFVNNHINYTMSPVKGRVLFSYCMMMWCQCSCNQFWAKFLIKLLCPGCM